jgi:hypothetical protein
VFGARRGDKTRPGWRDQIVSDLAIARRCGWRVEWVRELNRDDYEVLVDMLRQETRDAERREF